MGSLGRLSALAAVCGFSTVIGPACSSSTPDSAGGAGSGASPSAAGTSSSSGGTTGIAGSLGTGGTTSAAGSPSTAGTTSGGSTGAAGTTNMSGAAGSAGSTGTAGSGGGSGLPNAVKSMGCGKAAGQELGMFVNHKETITASALVTEKWQPREYWVRLPANYDSNRAYPAVFVGPGCGGKGNNAQPIQNASGNDAIVVGIDYSASATGRDCFMTEAFPDPEVNYVEETAANVEAAFCVDKSRLFIEGFSSGSWIAYMEGCVDGGPGGLFKGIGTATGNWQGSLPDTACKGPVAFFGSHDSGDPQGYNMYPGGRDHVLKLNGCTMPAVTTPYDAGPMVKAPTGNSTVTCVQYMGCQAPTVFCTTTGLGHNDQVASGISTYGFWKFWMSLP